LWDPTTYRTVRVLEGHADQVGSIRERLLGPVRVARFSPDGKRLVTAGDAVRARKWLPDGRGLSEPVFPVTPVRLWDVATGSELPGCGGHEGAVTVVQFSADGKRLLTAETEGLSEVAFRSPDEALWSSWGTSKRNQAVRVWNAETVEQLAFWKEEEALVSAG